MILDASRVLLALNLRERARESNGDRGSGYFRRRSASLKIFRRRLDESKCAAVGNHAVALAETIKPAFPLAAERVAVEPPTADDVIAVSGEAFHRTMPF